MIHKCTSNDNLVVQYWVCPKDNTKINASAVCDGHPDCPHNEDEDQNMCHGKSKGHNYLGIALSSFVFMGFAAFALGS